MLPPPQWPRYFEELLSSRRSAPFSTNRFRKSGGPPTSPALPRSVLRSHGAGRVVFQCSHVLGTGADGRARSARARRPRDGRSAARALRRRSSAGSGGRRRLTRTPEPRGAGPRRDDGADRRLAPEARSPPARRAKPSWFPWVTTPPTWRSAAAPTRLRRRSRRARSCRAWPARTPPSPSSTHVRCRGRIPTACSPCPRAGAGSECWSTPTRRTSPWLRTECARCSRPRPAGSTSTASARSMPGRASGTCGSWTRSTVPWKRSSCAKGSGCQSRRPRTTIRSASPLRGHYLRPRRALALRALPVSAPGTVHPLCGIRLRDHDEDATRVTAERIRSCPLSGHVGSKFRAGRIRARGPSFSGC